MKKIFATIASMLMVLSTMFVMAGAVSAADVTAPTIDDLAPVPESFVSPLMSGGINVSASYTDVGSGIDLETPSLKLNDEAVDLTIKADQAYTGTIYLDDGWYEAVFTVKDTSGNLASADWWFCVDSVMPKVSIKSPTFSLFTKTSSTPQITATISDNIDVAGFQILVDAKAVSKATVKETGPGAYSVSYKVPSSAALRSGYHTVTVMATDLAGNIGMGMVFFKV